MTRTRRAAIWIIVIGCAGAVTAGVITIRKQRRKAQPIVLRGAVLKQNADTRNQSPIADVVVSAANGMAAADTQTDFSGAFRLTLRSYVLPAEPITLTFRHPDYQPLDLNEKVTDELYVARMAPLHGELDAQANPATTVIGNVTVRYSTEVTSTDNIGTGAKTFQVENMGNVPCNKRPPCSPDGKWKAAVGSASLDAGEGNVFANARVTCIAGACPYTKVDTDGFSRGGRNIKVSMLVWSDTATFLLQAEVFHPQVGNAIRRSYPVIFGRAMNFTLPNTAQGPSIEAELNATLIVFPLGPSPVLSWADCNVRVEQNQAKDYRCELKAGYRFK
jgi:hypothetical protein